MLIIAASYAEADCDKFYSHSLLLSLQMIIGLSCFSLSVIFRHLKKCQNIKHQNRQRSLIYFFLFSWLLWPIWTIFFQALNCLEVEIGALSLHNESQQGSVQLLWVVWNVVFSQSRPTTNCHGLNTVKHVCHAGFNTQGDALSNRFFFLNLHVIYCLWTIQKYTVL